MVAIGAGIEYLWRAVIVFNILFTIHLIIVGYYVFFIKSSKIPNFIKKNKGSTN